MNRSILLEFLGKRLISSVITICSSFLFAASCMAQNGTEMTTVQGLGYPPIRAESAAQAHLMAKRAAVVDAYRNALASKAFNGQGSDIRYEELSGFVSGMSIVKEEYLKDGGIRITAMIPNKYIVPSAGSEMKGSNSRRGPQAVTLDEWYSIINNLVRYE